jgi:hypothetical protein
MTRKPKWMPKFRHLCYTRAFHYFEGRKTIEPRRNSCGVEERTREDRQGPCRFGRTVPKQDHAICRGQTRRSPSHQRGRSQAPLRHNEKKVGRASRQSPPWESKTDPSPPICCGSSEDCSGAASALGNTETRAEEHRLDIHAAKWETNQISNIEVTVFGNTAIATVEMAMCR